MKNFGWRAAFDQQALLIICLFILIVRVIYIKWVSPYGLGPDEAQYWTWLRHNDWSFLTKPPLTTWLMGVSTFVLGNTMIGVKLFALVGQVVTAVLGFYLARAIGGRAAGWWSFGLISAVPLVAVGGLIMSPDVVLLPLWMAALLVFTLLVKDEKRADGWRWWILMGVFAGLAGLAKYSAVMFYPLLGLYLTLVKKEWWLKPQVWVSGLISLSFQAPVLWWNFTENWEGMEHVLWQANGGGDARHGGIQSFFEFMGGQLGVVGPVVFVALLAAWGWAVWRWRKDDDLQKVVLIFSAPIFLGFVGLTMHGKVQANWPVLATVPGLVLLGVWVARLRIKWLNVLMIVGCGVNVVAGILMLDTAAFRAMHLFPVSARHDPTKEMRGWVEAGELLGLLLNRLDNPVVMATRYQTLAQVMFHTPGVGDVAYVRAGARRSNEYDLWAWPDMSRRVVAYVSENSSLPVEVKGIFKQCKPWHSLGAEDHGEVTRQLWVWVCWDVENLPKRWSPRDEDDKD